MSLLQYRLDDLGWHNFERLCQTLLQIKCGIGIEGWSGSGDWGRDAYFKGKLKYPSRAIETGEFVFQCKFVAGANAAGSKPYNALIGSVRSEAKRIKKHIKCGRWSKNINHYILLTNSRVASVKRKEIEKILAKVIPDTSIHIHPGLDVCNWINSTREILQSFPQLWSIADIDIILSDAVNRSTLERSATALELAKLKAGTFVETSAYSEALDKLGETGFVVLEGPPEMGKTTIGRVIALSQVIRGWDAYECRKPAEVLACYKRDRCQVFVADDFFGRTEYEPQRVSDWQAELSHILPKLGKNHWLILTCRAHLLEMGKDVLDVAEYSDQFPEIGEVTVNAGNLTELEKGKILYRHAKSAKLSAIWKKWIVSNVSDIVEDWHYTPERIRRMIQSCKAGKQDTQNYGENVLLSLKKPTEQMDRSFTSLPEQYKWMLFSLLDLGESKNINKVYSNLCPENLLTNPDKILNALTEGFLSYQDDQYDWIHPSCRDLAVSFLSHDPNGRRHFLTCCSLSGLKLACSLGGGFCGNVDLPLLKEGKDWSVFLDRVNSLKEELIDMFCSISTSMNELKRKDPKHLGIPNLEYIEAQLIGRIPSALKDVEYDDYYKLETCTEALKHTSLGFDLQPQINSCHIAAHSWSQNRSWYLWDDSSTLEDIQWFLALAESSAPQFVATKTEIQSIVDLVISRCSEEEIEFEYNSESEADHAEFGYNQISEYLSGLEELSIITETQKQKLHELSSLFGQLDLNYSKDTEDPPKIDKPIAPESQNVNLRSLFSDL